MVLRKTIPPRGVSSTKVLSSGYPSMRSFSSPSHSPSASFVSKDKESPSLTTMQNAVEMMGIMDQEARTLRNAMKTREEKNSRSCFPRLWSNRNKVHDAKMNVKKINLNSAGADALSFEEELYDNVRLNFEKIKTNLLQSAKEGDFTEEDYRKVFDGFKTDFNQHLNNPYFKSLLNSVDDKFSLFHEYYKSMQKMGVVENPLFAHRLN